MSKKETTKFIVQLIASIDLVYGLLDKQSSIIFEWSGICHFLNLYKNFYHQNLIFRLIS